MDDQLQDLRVKLPVLSEEELLRIATVDREQYTPEALALVVAELQRRGVVEITQERYNRFRTERQATEASARKKPGRWHTWIYPHIVDLSSAKRAARQGLVAALITASVTALFAVLAAQNVQAVTALGIDASAFVDVALFLAVAFGIWRGWRTAAVAGLVLFVAEKIFYWVTVGVPPKGLAFFLAIAFVNGVRGTFALRKLTMNGVSAATYNPVEPS